jgi:hypothetical protein
MAKTPSGAATKALQQELKSLQKGLNFFYFSKLMLKNLNLK